MVSDKEEEEEEEEDEEHRLEAFATRSLISLSRSEL